MNKRKRSVKTKRSAAKKLPQALQNGPSTIIRPPRLYVVPIIIVALVSGYIGGYGHAYLNEPEVATQPSEPTPVAIRADIPKYEPQSSQHLENIDDLHKSIVGIYQKPLKKAEHLSINEMTLAGNAVVLTSDGWIATPVATLGNKKWDSFMAITAENKVIELSTPIIDAVTQTAFIKIDANNLTVTHFAKKKDVMPSMPVFAIDHSKSVTATSIMSTQHLSAKTLSSDSYNTRMSLNSTIASPGTPIFTQDGKIIGISTDDNKVLPLDFMNPILKQVFKNEKIERPSFGFEYLPLHLYVHQITEEDVKNNPLKKLNSGALITKISTKDSLLKVDDIILKVDDTPVNKDHLLSELLLDYQPSESVNLQILRDSIEQEITIEL